MPALSSYRENHDRCIFIDAAINQDLVRALTPKILQLKKASLEPITVYIDSPGGHTRQADTLQNLLRAESADEDVCEIITVVTGTAASAAADFLASGNYAIGYPNSIVHFHGTRHSGVEELTMEVAAFTAKALRDYNDIVALELARRVIERSIFIFLNLRDSFYEIRVEEGNTQMPDLECFARALVARMSYGSYKIPQRAFLKYQAIQELSNNAFARAKIKPKDTTIQIESKLLKALIDQEIKNRKNGEIWLFDDDVLGHLIENFRLIKDYHAGSHNRWLNSIVYKLGRYFLDDTEAAHIDGMPVDTPEDRAARRKWLSNKALPRLQPIWFFVVSVCRLLQEKENQLSIIDAYWLGIVDEVLGSGLPCPRQMFENAPPAV